MLSPPFVARLNNSITRPFDRVGRDCLTPSQQVRLANWIAGCARLLIDPRNLSGYRRKLRVLCVTLPPSEDVYPTADESARGVRAVRAFHLGLRDLYIFAWSIRKQVPNRPLLNLSEKLKSYTKFTLHACLHHVLTHRRLVKRGVDGLLLLLATLPGVLTV